MEIEIRERTAIRVDLPANTSRRESRKIIEDMREWCKQNLHNDVQAWYTNMVPDKYSIWRICSKNDATLFRLKFGGSIY